MSAEFDPYHKWLGIPPGQRPPTHYRLLGLENYEQDADVIEAAANQRAAYLHDLATGEHVELSQKLLNEIAQARRVLLDADRKRDYDAELRAAEKPAQKPGPQTRVPLWALIGGGAGAAALVAVLLFVAFGRNGGGKEKTETTVSITITWPLDEREEAALLVDGKERELPDTDKVLLELSNEEHGIKLKRRGYRDISLSFDPKRSKDQHYRLNWRPR